MTDADINVCAATGSKVAEALSAGSSWQRPDGGMFLWARLPESYDTTALLAEVVRHDVAYVPGAPFYAGEPDRSPCGCVS